jgi:chromosomal replication initiator protein
VDRPCTPIDAELEGLWNEIRLQLARAVPAGTYEIWLTQLRAHELTESALVLTGPEPVTRWVADRFGRVLQTCAAAVLGPDIVVEVIPERTAAQRREAPSREPGRADDINPKYTFEQFVIGEGNRLAHAAALAVAELPGQAYNPLFIYGPPGVGKTHLLHSIAAYLVEHGGGLSVRCSTIESFTSHFVTALQSGSMERFKAAYRDVDVLLVDDVQFLQDKTRTEEEFFHTFNALHETGSQLVLTCDRLPGDMDALETRLRERFESGLLADISAPDFSTRLAILHKRASHDGVEVSDDDILAAIAERVTDNVRALEGALIRVVAYASMTGQPLTAPLAGQVLDRLSPRPRTRRPSVREIQEETAAAFDLSLDELLSGGRSARLAWPRQLAMYLTRELTDETLPAIGRQFGGRDHSTVLYSCKRAADRIDSDSVANSFARNLSHRLRSGPGDRLD